MSDSSRPGLTERIRRFPWLFARAPTWLVLLGGVAITALGVLIVTRPPTSLVLLGVYIGVSASSSRDSPTCWEMVRLCHGAPGR